MKYTNEELKYRRCQIIASIIFQTYEEGLDSHTRISELLIPDNWAQVGSSSPTSKYREHIVPLAYLRNESMKIFREAANPSDAIPQVVKLWFDNYQVAYITKAEADHLNTKFRTSMPDKWKIGDNPRERLWAMGIKLDSDSEIKKCS